MDSRGLYVGQLPLSASDAKLRELFEPYGPVKTIINNVLKGYAFLYFTNPRHVDAAMAEPAHYMDGQVREHTHTLSLSLSPALHPPPPTQRLRVESKSTRDYRDQKKQEEAEEADRERARKRRDGYDAGEAGLQSLQEQRRRAAEEKRREFDARHRERLVEMERQESAEADAGEADEMPVIKKRTPPKGAAGDGRGGGGGRGGLLRFAFAESSEGESVSVEGAGGVARYVVQGKTKGPFTEVGAGYWLLLASFFVFFCISFVPCTKK